VRFSNIFTALSDMAKRAKQSFSEALIPKSNRRLTVSNGGRRISNKEKSFATFNLIKDTGFKAKPLVKSEKLTRGTGASKVVFPERFTINDVKIPSTSKTKKQDGLIIKNFQNMEAPKLEEDFRSQISDLVTPLSSPKVTAAETRTIEPIEISNKKTVKIIQPIVISNNDGRLTEDFSSARQTLQREDEALQTVLPKQTPLGVRLSLENMIDSMSQLVMSSVPGLAGTDYPIYSEVPETDFICSQQEFPGIFADVESGCQAFHMCPPSGESSSFLCPNGTIFSQQYFVCDWWYNLDCDAQPNFFNLNQNLYTELENNVVCKTLFCIDD